VALRPPNTTVLDASTNVPFWKQVYYQYQIETHEDKVAAAAGDHLNLSAPWMDQNPQEVSKKMIEMTARMRLIASALSIGLTAASPLHYYANGGEKNAKYGTSITPWESARLGSVWPNRTIMDVADLYRDPISFRKTMDKFRRKNVLKSGRDIWLPVRAQPQLEKPHQELPDLCEKIGLDLTIEDHRNQVHDYLMASFQHGPNNPTDNPFSTDPLWKKIEEWRQQTLKDIKKAPRNRVELRTFETPPAFDDQTPYEYIKAVYSFFELLFIYLSQNPEFVQNLEYDSINLQAAKSNETAVLLGGMDTPIQWIPRMTTTTPRDLLQVLLVRIQDLAQGLGRTSDLEPLNRIIQGGLKTPAERIRQEVGRWYDININQRHNPRLLPDDSYPKHLLTRTREAMTTELLQIDADLQKIPLKDRPYIENLLCMVKQSLTS